MRQITKPSNLIATVATFIALFGGSLVAGDFGKAIINDKMPIASDPWTICNTFDNNTLLESDTGFIREVSLHGRYQGQYISHQEDVGGAVNNGYHNWQHRRARLGIEIEMDGNLRFYTEANIANGHQLTNGVFFDAHHFFYLEWENSEGTSIRVGKQKQHITREDIESSKSMKTVERTHIVNESAGGRPWGVVFGFETGVVSHKLGGWLYGSHAASPQWVDFEANAGFSYNLKYDLNETTNLYFDYVYADNLGGLGSTAGPAANGFGPEYEHAFALGADYENERLELITDFIYAANRTGAGGVPAGNDTWGFYVMPSYDISEDLEAVFRYGYMDEGRNHRPQSLSARQAVENYHQFYLGLQYFICGEKFKVMGGYEYATGEILNTATSVDSGSWQFAVRAYF